MDVIRIRGARTHNLRNIDLDLPRNRLTVITGLSGSGKSSLAFDTLYAEGQRRYVESLSSYARQFLQQMDKPEVDSIEGLSPAIAIEQKATSHNPRSTVGTVTEIHDYLRVLFARAGIPHCPDHPEHALSAHTVSQMVDVALQQPEGTRLMVLAPVVSGRKGEHLDLLASLRAQGFVRVRIDGAIHELDTPPKLAKTRAHDIDVVVDRLRARADVRQRLAESFETALRLGDGRATLVNLDDGAEQVFSARFACPVCNFALPELEPRLFSFNSPSGACPQCEGLGVIEVPDAARVVAHPERSLAGGAIRGWDARTPFYHQLLESLARHYGIDLQKPFEQLDARHQQVLLHGSGDEAIAFDYASDRRTVSKSHPFEGILPNLARRYRETQSAAVREELAQFHSMQPCSQCGGARLRREARHVHIGDATLPALARLSLDAAAEFFATLALPGQRGEIAASLVDEISARLRFLRDVGLAYLTLDRAADTLSGGEAQRIRLASQIGSGLTGVLYVLDEPSIGLHARDNLRLLGTLARLRDQGNTLIVVEHDEEAIRAADHVVDMGPGAGSEGGAVVAQGTPADIIATPASLTGDYLAGRRTIALPAARRTPPEPERWLRLSGCNGNNLRDVTLELPAGLFVCVTGVSGSGKSTLINDTLHAVTARHYLRATTEPAPFREVSGLDLFDKVINVDQAPIGRTPRSNPATYTGLFTPVRELFAGVPEARARGYTSGRFSFNVKGGRCEACQGDGVLRVEMHFLPDIYVSCDVCKGRRYNRETLEITWRGLNIAEVLDMTVAQAFEFFSAVPTLARKLQTLLDVGLGYIRLGQSATTLSGGEAQRVKLALELSRRDTGRTLYILDEPTTGLHFHDIALLLDILTRLREQGNTVVVIEHNLDVIKCADWIIDLGPEGGSGGGQIVAAGTPEDVARAPGSHTGQFLAELLARPAP